MTARQFFKSTTFKCLVTLLSILLVCGVFLTVMNGLLEVTDEERLSRAISKIYGESVTTTEVEIENKELDNATIEAAYFVEDDGNYLVKATGKNGFSNGTVTCWIVVSMTDGAISGIKKVTVDSNVGQTQMAEIKDSFLEKFSTGYKDDIYYTTGDGFVVTNSSMTSTAICNAVNGALEYVNAERLGNASVNKFADFELTTFTGVGSAVTNTVNTKLSDFTVEGDVVTYHLVTNGNGMAGSFTINIKVGADKTITEYVIETHGSVENGYEFISAEEYNEKVDAIVSTYVGKGYDYFTGIFSDMVYPGNGKDTIISTGATQSNFICFVAGAFATANYDNCINYTEEGGAE